MSADNNELRWVGGPGSAIPARKAPPAPRRFLDEDPQPIRVEEQIEADEPSLAVTLMHYVHVVWRRRWLVAACFVAGVAAAFAVTLLTTPMYRATMTLDIDREPAKVAAVESEESTPETGAQEFYQTQYAALKSRALAERIVANLNLAYDERFLNQYDPRALQSALSKPRTAQIPGDRKERTEKAVKLLMDGLRVEPVPRSRLVKVSYESPSPQVAERIANAVAPNYISANLERRYGASAYARQFLETRLSQIRERLEESERALVAYAAANQIITVTQGGSAPGTVAPPPQSLAESDLAAKAAARAQAEVNLAAAQARWVQASNTPATSLPEVLSDTTYRAAEENLAKLKSAYQENLAKYQPTHRDMVRQQEIIQAEERRVASIAERIKNSIREQYNVALRNQQQLASSVGAGKGAVLDTREKSIEYNILQREVDTNRILYDGLLQRYKEIGVAGGVGANNISVLDRAQVPTAPIRPEPMKNLLRFALLGLLIGVGVAVLLEQFDVSLKVPEEVEDRLRLPLLGTIPRVEGGEAPVRTLADPRSALSEGYHSVRTALQFSTEEGAPSSLLVTSPRAAEGKTTSAVAIATSFARLGKRVLIIDADLRAPSLHKIFARENGVGLSNYLTSGADLWAGLQPTDQKNLSFLGSGPLPPNPAELFSGERMWSLLKEAADSFDMVVIDGPPIMGLADAPSLANYVEGTVLVVEAGGTNRETAKAAIRRLKLGRARLLGVLMTKFDHRKAGYRYGHAYGYGYGYGYGHEYGVTTPRRKETAIARIAGLLNRSSPA